MDKSNNNRKNYGTAFFAMAFLVAFFFELYWIMTKPYEHFMMIGTGIIMIIMGYLTIDSLLKAKADSDAARNEQNEMMLKAQKAIYIATKKNAKEAEVSQVRSLKAMELMMNKMISTQQALLEDKKPVADDMSSLIDQLSESNEKLAKEVQAAITVNQLVKANADLVKNVKEALSANTMSTGSLSDLTSYVNEAVSTPNVQPTKIMTAPVEEPIFETPVMDNEPILETPVIDDEPILNTSVVDDEPMLNASVIDDEPILEAPVTDDEPILDTSVVDDVLNEFDMSEISPEADLNVNTMTAMENEINLAEMEASEALEDMIIPDEMTTELEEAMDDGNPEEIMTEPDSPFNVPSDENPNKQLTEEEIAALFASL